MKITVTWKRIAYSPFELFPANVDLCFFILTGNPDRFDCFVRARRK